VIGVEIVGVAVVGEAEGGLVLIAVMGDVVGRLEGDSVGGRVEITGEEEGGMVGSSVTEGMDGG